MSEDYWDGANWIYEVNIANDDQGAANIAVEIVPGAGNEMELLYAGLQQLDTVGRTISILIEDDTDNIIAILSELSLTENQRIHLPMSNNEASTARVSSAGARLIISGNQVLRFQVASVALSQDAKFAVVCRIRGGVPTVTETGGGVIVVTINTEKVF